MRKPFKLMALVGALLCVDVPASVFAQALPVDPIAKAVTGAMQNNYFFKAADFSKQSSTITKMSESAMRAAANAPTITGAVAGTSWASALRFLGKTTLPSIAISLAVEGAIQWYFGDDPSAPTLGVDEVLIPGAPTYAVPPKAGLDPITGVNNPMVPSGTPINLVGQLNYGQSYFRSSVWINGVTWEYLGMNAVSLVAEMMADSTLWTNVSDIQCYWGMAKYECTGRATSTVSGETWTNAQLGVASGGHNSDGPVKCPGGYLYKGLWPSDTGGTRTGQCSPDPSPVPGGDSIQTLDSATHAIPSNELAKAVNPQVVANLANQLWLDAASQPGYDGVPYSQSNPVSQWDAQNWMNANPSLWPKVEALVNSAPRTEINVWTLPAPTPSTDPNPDPNPNPNPTVDLGPDPGIGQPGLEATPTAAMIIEPLKQFFPDLKNYTVSLPAGECPRPSFDAFGSSFTVSTHCDLLEQNRSLIQLCMMAAFGILALLIVLRA